MRALVNSILEQFNKPPESALVEFEAIPEVLGERGLVVYPEHPTVATIPDFVTQRFSLPRQRLPAEIAEEMRLGITDAEMKKIILEVPAFTGVRKRADVEKIVRECVPAIVLAADDADVERLVMAQRLNLDMRHSKYYGEMREKTRKVFENGLPEIEGMHLGWCGRQYVVLSCLMINIEVMKEFFQTWALVEPRVRQKLV